MTPPFRADQVGSLLRPAQLAAARKQAKAGAISAAQLKEVEDRCIRAAVAKRESVGLEAITDGEMRRDYWHLDFVKQIEGVTLKQAVGITFQAADVPPDKFDAMIERVKGCGVHVIGPVPLGGRFWSAYFLDPFGIRLEFATDRSGAGRGVIESVRQTEAEARTELETLFSDPKEVEKWLRHMPLKEEAHA